MNPPLLKLEFVKGPRDGESMEYKPGSTIRIGRIVRGNEIGIKDKGISTKHLRIVSDSENWVIQDLGSSNGTILNSDTLDPDTPVNLSHGDVIKLGEITSIVVNFLNDYVQEQERKLPPRPRRNNRRVPVLDPDLDPVQEEAEVPKRATRAARSKTLRVGRPRKNEKKVVVTNVVEEEEEEEGPVRVCRIQDLGLNTVKLEIEDTPKVVEVSAMNRGRRSKQIENVKCEDSFLEEKGPSRATRSRKKEICGDSFMELDMVLNQARKSRAKRKQVKQKASSSVVEMEGRNEDVEEDNEDQKGCSERSDGKEDEVPESVEQVEVELRKSRIGEEELNCSVREDGETVSLLDTIDEERNRKSEEEKVEQETSNKNVEKVEFDLRKMTAREWFESVSVQLLKQTTEETEKLIEPMRSKALRVQQYIAEQVEAKGKRK
ncbi:hypothetical protein AALP_AA3G017900 [Arabis alpina]|uniref:FHA domain-containing protein n=1 Tax=Arabis alpina TaxID=50452 RepID=A0A087H6F1_ARAAL|nr:hypothetical protein AALP_AA3G017900 [Arabis alpina]